jgi:excisionase family DNA binding protein
MTEPLLYSVNQVAQILNIGRTGTYDLIRSGRLKSVKIGSSRRIPSWAIEQFLQSIDV